MSPRQNWDSLNPSLASVWSPPPRTGGGGGIRVRGWGSPNSEDWRKSFALCLLCGTNLLARGRAVQREVSVEAEPQPLCCPVNGQSCRFSEIQNVPNDPATAFHCIRLFLCSKSIPYIRMKCFQKWHGCGGLPTLWPDLHDGGGPGYLHSGLICMTVVGLATCTLA
jgi:hypothetical protein